MKLIKTPAEHNKPAKPINQLSIKQQNPHPQPSAKQQNTTPVSKVNKPLTQTT